jgi:hypothetical protein
MRSTGNTQSNMKSTVKWHFYVETSDLFSFSSRTLRKFEAKQIELDNHCIEEKYELVRFPVQGSISLHADNHEK